MRLVARGFLQRQGLDFNEIYAPVARIETLRLVAAVAAHYGWSVYHLEVKSAFLNGTLEEEVYVRQPSSFGKRVKKARCAYCRKHSHYKKITH